MSVYTPNVGTPKCMKETLAGRKGGTEHRKSRRFRYPLSVMGRAPGSQSVNQIEDQ